MKRAKELVRTTRFRLPVNHAYFQFEGRRLHFMSIIRCAWGEESDTDDHQRPMTNFPNQDIDPQLNQLPLKVHKLHIRNGFKYAIKPTTYNRSCSFPITLGNLAKGPYNLNQSQANLYLSIKCLSNSPENNVYSTHLYKRTFVYWRR